ncbi:hypothetical protein TGAM01_v204864 [Trichoderma gamsii]|uniref:Uncharacterized protein n=1 Tax=Trichoderma gamsii TaxID=398673 RepID=A0A2P4ZQ47_9HYPO|nr:hypothetical protein TGAM01_v204864 [Trichoderma gamsii]PON26388.1 hypothetical protein TGAM01_v204864 [Trichoderma gamsii]
MTVNGEYTSTDNVQRFMEDETLMELVKGPEI